MCISSVSVATSMDLLFDAVVDSDMTSLKPFIYICQKTFSQRFSYTSLDSLFDWVNVFLWRQV